MDPDGACREFKALSKRIKNTLAKEKTTIDCVLRHATQLNVPRHVYRQIKTASNVRGARHVLIGYLNDLHADCGSGDSSILKEVVNKLQKYSEYLSPSAQKIMAAYFLHGMGKEKFGDVFAEMVRDEGNASGRILVNKAAVYGWSKNIMKLHKQLLMKVRNQGSDKAFEDELEKALLNISLYGDRVSSLEDVPGVSKLLNSEESFESRSAAKSETKDRVLSLVGSLSQAHKNIFTNVEWDKLESTTRQTLVWFYKRAIEKLAELKRTFIATFTRNYKCLPFVRIQESMQYHFKDAFEAMAYHSISPYCSEMYKDVSIIDELYVVLTDSFKTVLSTDPHVQKAILDYKKPILREELSSMAMLT